MASLEAILLLARVAGLKGKKEVLRRVPKLEASGPNAVCSCLFFITLIPSGPEKFLKDLPRYLS